LRILLLSAVWLPAQAALGCQVYTFDSWARWMSQASPLFVGVVTEINPPVDGPTGSGDAIVKVERVIRGVVGDTYSIEQPSTDDCRPKYKVGDRVLIPGDHPTYPAIAILSDRPTTPYQQAQMEFVERLLQ
jgi:hypothetical protein